MVSVKLHHDLKSNKTENIYFKNCHFNTSVTMTPIKRRKRKKKIVYRIFAILLLYHDIQT